ncbi:MAG: hypothetical protein BAJATHORv1_50033 [Candidatus Thorarchaeota archaeon]|nr:MAG: hypothetical protein BAJATHORv1_50033 [Candidatus Thorarchaeota archaeon]
MTDDISSDLQPNYKLWLEHKGEYVFGPGAYAILSSIDREGTITKGAEALGMSYRYAWGVVKKIEKKLGLPLLETFKGGTVGGGGAVVTEYGKQLMEMFVRVKSEFDRVIEDQ